MRDTEFVVTADDGRLFHCEIALVGHVQQPHWMFCDTAGLEYVGPPVAGERTPEDVRRMVADWWRVNRAFGHAGPRSHASLAE